MVVNMKNFCQIVKSTASTVKKGFVFIHETFSLVVEKMNNVANCLDNLCGTKSVVKSVEEYEMDTKIGASEDTTKNDVLGDYINYSENSDVVTS